MEKFKGYIGVLITLFFCVFLLPVKDRWNSSSALRMTPLDDTIIIMATLRFGDRWQFVDTVATFLRDCNNGSSPKPLPSNSLWKKTEPTPCIFLFDIVRPNIVADSLPYIYNEIDEKKYWDQYVDYVENRSRMGRENVRELLKPEIIALHKPLGTAIAKYADSVKGELTLLIYLIYSATIITIGLMLVLRRKLGGAIVYPIIFFTKFFFKAAKTTAKKIHDEI